MPGVSTCTECGAELHGRADATYCSSACRQRAYRRRNASTVTATRRGVDPGRPVPAASRLWSHNRFWTFPRSPWDFGTERHPGYPHPSRLERSDADHIEHYVFNVASIAEMAISGSPGYEPEPDNYPYNVGDPLPDELPAEVTPEDADFLASWLEPGIDRATELLALLKRRAREDA
jgi:hypothetical protein